MDDKERASEEVIVVDGHKITRVGNIIKSPIDPRAYIEMRQGDIWFKVDEEDMAEKAKGDKAWRTLLAKFRA